MKYKISKNVGMNYRFNYLIEDTEGNYIAAFQDEEEAKMFLLKKNECNNHIVEFRNGDASVVYKMSRNKFELSVVKCGEMGLYSFDKWEEVDKFMRDCYGFDDELMHELKMKIKVYADK